ncbi:dihydroxyacetone kinase phosphoryl donor subunit DhaM [Pseudarthrobacter sp. J64]|uniref:dihydroxyacetone kinase phosphoryl donor subunit DhaM n=1 Tax=Pseudarthrobacter sp. J64 TaxID=3116485 RepID=UPI002E808C16|nr:dihydroxyacetone kinase phosphoryl donor subunit DhaM [Pseudarthrobacter sp. J64]MEE2570268.1 dihydroxyacetone kinase phosphoryl donor subunit DhaM [Pseudarthrobacter sp. J64]
MSVRLVVVSHSEKIADGAAELAAQMAPDVQILAAGGTGDGRIGTSLEKVMAALDGATGGDGTVVLADLGSAVMTAESAIEFAEDPGSVLLADAPLVEGLVAAAVAAQSGADAEAVKAAAEAVAATFAGGQGGGDAAGEPAAVEPSEPDVTADFELVNQAGMHARPAAKIAGGISGLDAEVTINGIDAASMTGLMTLAAGKGSVLHVAASGPDAEKAVGYVGDLVRSGFGEP